MVLNFEHVDVVGARLKTRSVECLNDMTTAPSFASFPDIFGQGNSNGKKESKKESDHVSDKDVRHRKRRRTSRERDEEKYRHGQHDERKYRHSRHRDHEDAITSRDMVNKSDNVSASSEKKDHHSSKHRHRKDESTRKAVVKKSEFTSGTSADRSLYTIDTRGDKDALTYGRLYQWDIPRYFRYGAGRILGLTPAYRIDRASAKAGVGLEVRKLRMADQRYIDAKVHLNAPSRRITVGKAITAKEADHDLILLTQKAAKDTDDGGYRSVHGMVKDEFSDSEADSEAVTSDTIRQRNISLNKRLATDSHDIDGWLEFIAFQAESAGYRKTSLSNVERASVCEIQLSIYQRALQHNEGNEKLLIGYLETGAVIWDSVKLLAEWNRILNTHPHIINLWTTYLNVRQTTSSSFTVSDCKKCYQECIAKLRLAVVDHYSRREQLESVLVYIFLRACSFLRDAGHSEAAITAFQAIMDLNFYRRKKLNVEIPEHATYEQEHDLSLEALREYWDAEKPRFGESLGLARIPEHNVSNGERTIPTWISAEIQTSETLWKPARVSDDDPSTEDDPFRVVVFDDLKELMFVLTTSEARLRLAYSLLQFLGLSIVPPGTASNSELMISNDPFVQIGLVDPSNRADFWPLQGQQIPTLQFVDGEPMEPTREPGLTSPYTFPLKVFPASMQTTFADSTSDFGMLKSMDVKQPLKAFARAVFSELHPFLAQDELFAAYMFRFEYLIEGKSARKLAKTLLSEQRLNLHLWNAYAELEYSQGKLDAARKVYVSALSTYATFPLDAQAAAPLLWRTWTIMEWEQGNTDLALQILCSMPEQIIDSGILDQKAAPSPSRFLRAQRYLAERSNEAISIGASESSIANAIHYHVCYAILEYLHTGIEAAARVYNRVLDRIKELRLEGTAEHEEVVIAYAALLWRHSRSSSAYKPAALRSVLDAGLQVFPQNTILLSYYLANEARMRIDNRVRRMLQEVVLTDKNATFVGWIFALYTELHLVKGSYNVNLVRDLFERAVSSLKAQHSPALWSLYIDFERRHDIERVKGVYYRALRSCPWYKDLYLAAFNMRDVFTPNELVEVYKVMLEKEIRVRVELEIDRLIV